MGASSSKSKPVFFKGQKELGDMLFAPGGIFANILSGAPDPRFESDARRGSQALNQSLASQGILGTPLAAKSQALFQSQVQTGREQNRLQNLLTGIQPAGTSSIGSKAGLFAK